MFPISDMALDEPNDRGRGWRKIAPRQAVLWLLLISYTVFLVGFLVLPDEYEHAHFVFFRYCVFGLACLTLPFVFPRLRRSLLFYLLLLFLGYMVATVFWSQPPLAYESWREGAWQVSRLGALILGFVVATVALRTELGTAFETSLKIVAMAAGAFALITIFYWYSHHPFPESRLTGLGFISNPNFTAGLYGVFAVMTCSFMNKAPGLWSRLAYAVLFAVLSGYVVLTQSRAPLIALLLSSSVLVFGKRRREAIAGISVLLGVIVLFAVTYPELIRSALMRGLSYRLDIWQGLLAQISEAPWIGHGYLAHRPEIAVGSQSFMVAHNAYLATLRDGGAIGLWLLITLLGYSLWCAIRLGRRAQDYTVFAIMLFGVLCIAVLSDQLIVRHEMEWLLVWFSLGLVLADDSSTRSWRANAGLRSPSRKQGPRD